MDYNYLLVDAQYMITRNFHQQVKTPQYYSKGGMLKGMIQSIAKLAREVKCNKIILLWDSSPYHKITILKDYKQDRTYVTEADLTPDKTPEELESIRKKIEQFKIRQEVKYQLITDGEKLGFLSLIKSGYEADDWAMMLADHPDIKNHNKKSIVASADSDWWYFMNESVDYYSLHNNAVLKHRVFEDIKSEVNGVHPYKYKTLIDSWTGSHNNLTDVRNGDFTVDQILLMIENNDYSFTNNEELFKLQLKSFQVHEYPEYSKAVWLMNKKLNQEISFMGSTEFSQYCFDNHMKINYPYYESFIESLK